MRSMPSSLIVEQHRATALSYMGITGTLYQSKRAALQSQASYIKLDLPFFHIQLEWNIGPILQLGMNVKMKTTVV